MSKLLDQHQHFSLQIRDCKFGRGVFAAKNFKRYELIEVCPCLVFSNHDTHMAWLSTASVLERYYFDFDENHSALALGYGSLYNHSAKNFNADYSVNLKEKEIVLYAAKPIKKNSQIFIDYGYDPVKLFK